jgi:hypothetical protein
MNVWLYQFVKFLHASSSSDLQLGMCVYPSQKPRYSLVFSLLDSLIFIVLHWFLDLYSPIGVSTRQQQVDEWRGPGSCWHLGKHHGLAEEMNVCWDLGCLPIILRKGLPFHVLRKYTRETLPHTLKFRTNIRRTTLI